MKKLWPLRTFHGPFPVGRDLLTCSTEYTLPVCFGCALASGMVSICFILLVRVIAASRREATFRHRHRRELRMNEGRYLRRSTHPPRHWVTKHRRTPHRGNRGARRWLGMARHSALSRSSRACWASVVEKLPSAGGSKDLIGTELDA